MTPFCSPIARKVQCPLIAIPLLRFILDVSEHEYEYEYEYEHEHEHEAGTPERRNAGTPECAASACRADRK